jgi:hypothetical protein
MHSYFEFCILIDWWLTPTLAIFQLYRGVNKNCVYMWILSVMRYKGSIYTVSSLTVIGMYFFYYILINESELLTCNYILNPTFVSYEFD